MYNIVLGIITLSIIILLILIIFEHEINKRLWGILIGMVSVILVPISVVGISEVIKKKRTKSISGSGYYPIDYNHRKNIFVQKSTYGGVEDLVSNFDIIDLSAEELDKKKYQLQKQNNEIEKILKTMDYFDMKSGNILVKYSYFKNKSTQPIWNDTLIKQLAKRINMKFSHNESVLKKIKGKPNMTYNENEMNLSIINNLISSQKSTIPKDVMIINPILFQDIDKLNKFINTTLKNLGLNQSNLEGIDTYTSKFKEMQEYISKSSSNLKTQSDLDTDLVKLKNNIDNVNFNNLKDSYDINFNTIFKSTDDIIDNDRLINNINKDDLNLFLLYLVNVESMNELDKYKECTNCASLFKGKIQNLENQIVKFKLADDLYKKEKSELTTKLDNLNNENEENKRVMIINSKMANENYTKFVDVEIKLKESITNNNNCKLDFENLQVKQKNLENDLMELRKINFDNNNLISIKENEINKIKTDLDKLQSIISGNNNYIQKLTDQITELTNNLKIITDRNTENELKNKRLTTDIEQLNDKIKLLEDASRNRFDIEKPLLEKIDNLSIAKAKLEKDITNTKVELDNIKKDMDEKELNYINCKSESIDISKRIDTLNEQYDNIIKENKTIKDKNIKFGETITDMKKTHEYEQSQLSDTINKLRDDKEKLQERINDYELKYDTSMDADIIDNLKVDKEQLNEQIKELTSKIKELNIDQQKINENEKLLNINKEARNKLMAEKRELDSIITKLNSEIVQNKSEFDKKIQEYKDDIKNLEDITEKDNIKFNNQINNIISKYSELKYSFKNIEDILSKKKGLDYAIDIKLNKIANDIDVIIKMKDEKIQELNKSNEESKLQLTDLQSKYANIQNELKESEAKGKQLDEMKLNILNLTNTNSEIQTTNKELNNKLSNFEKIQNELYNLQESVKLNNLSENELKNIFTIIAKNSAKLNSFVSEVNSNEDIFPFDFQLLDTNTINKIQSEDYKSKLIFYNQYCSDFNKSILLMINKINESKEKITILESNINSINKQNKSIFDKLTGFITNLIPTYIFDNKTYVTNEQQLRILQFNDNYTELLNIHKNYISDIKEKYNNLQNAIDKLKNEKLTDQDAINKLQSQISKDTKTIDDKEFIIKKLQDKDTENKKQIDNYISEINLNKVKNDDLLKQIEDITKRDTAINSEIELIKQQNKVLQEQSTSSSYWIGKDAENNKIISNLKAQDLANKNKITTLELAIKNNLLQIAKLNDELKNIKDNTRSLEDYNKIQTSLDNNNIEISTLKKLIDEKEKLLLDCTKEKESITAKLNNEIKQLNDNLQNNYISKDVYNNEIEKINNEKLELLTNNETLKKQINNLTDINTNEINKVQKANVLIEQLKSARDSIQTELDTITNGNKDNINKLNEELRQLKDKETQLLLENQTLTNKISKLNKDLEDNKNMLSDITLKNKDLESQNKKIINENKIKINNNLEMITKLNQDNAESEAVIKLQLSKINKINAENANLLFKSKDMDDKYRELEISKGTISENAKIINDLESKNKELYILNKELTNSNQLLSDDLLNKSNKITELETNINNIQTEKNKIEAMLDKERKSIINMTKTSNLTLKELNDLKTKFDNISKLNMQLNSDLKNERDNIIKVIDNINKSTDGNYNNLTEVGTKFIELFGNNKLVNKNINDYVVKYNLLVLENNKIKDELAKNKITLDILNAENTKSSQDLQQKWIKVQNNLKTQLEINKQLTEQFKSDIQELINKHKIENNNLLAANNKLNYQLTKVINENNKNKDIIDNLNKLKDELTISSNAEISKLREINLDLNKNIIDLKTKITDLNSNNIELNKQINELKDRIIKLNSDKFIKVEHELTNAELKERVRILEDQLNENIKEKDLIKLALMNKENKLKDENTKLKSDYEARINLIESRNRQLEEDIKNLTLFKSETIKELETCNLIKFRLNNEINDLNKLNNKIKLEYEQLSNINKQQLEEIKTYILNIEICNNNLTKCNNNLGKCNSNLTEFKQKLQTCNVDLDSYKKELDSAKEKIDMSITNIELIKNKNIELEIAKSDLKSEIIVLKNENYQLKNENAKLQMTELTQIAEPTQIAGDDYYYIIEKNKILPFNQEHYNKMLSTQYEHKVETNDNYSKFINNSTYIK